MTSRKKRKGYVYRQRGAPKPKIERRKKTFGTIQPVSWKESVLNVKNLFPELFKVIIKLGEGIDDLAEKENFTRRTYLFLYAILFLAAFTGMFIFGLSGGHNYFNPWYIYLVPILLVIFWTIIAYTFNYMFYFFWERGRFKIRKIILLKEFLIIYAITPLLWFLYPLKIIWPRWENHIFYLSVIVSLFLFIMVFIKGSKFFRKSDLIRGLVLAAIPYYAVLYFLPRLSEYCVRLFRL
jgi:hypothetical protein